MVCGNIFKVLSIPNHKSWGAEILRECSPPTMCHMSRVICHVSGVTCQVSRVTCNFIIIILFFLTQWWSLSGEGLLSTGPTPSSFHISGVFPAGQVFHKGQACHAFHTDHLFQTVTFFRLVTQFTWLTIKCVVWL